MNKLIINLDTYKILRNKILRNKIYLSIKQSDYIHVHIKETVKMIKIVLLYTRSWRGVLDTTLCDKVCQ